MWRAGIRIRNQPTMYPFRAPGLFVSQPFGTFFITALPARVLLDTAFSDRLQAVKNPDGSYRLEGSQRALMESRLKQIGHFIDSSSAAFPNALILAANYREQDGLIEDDEEEKWQIESTDGSPTGTLVIPEAKKLAPIIDGQHRLFGFHFSQIEDRQDMPLVCAIYFDLPKPYQAFLFATINANQRPVNKSQTYELFGYNVEDEAPERWTPEKLSVFLARKLNSDTESPLAHHVVIAAENDFALSMAEARRAGAWVVSTATVVEGIVKLISSNPKRDAYDMDGAVHYEGRTRSALRTSRRADESPLRELYLEQNDLLIFTYVKNYFLAVQETLWSDATPGSYLRKTVGIQALFDVARRLAHEAVRTRTIGVEFFASNLRRAAKIDFDDPFFRQASGTGRNRIRTVMELALELRAVSDLGSDPRLMRDEAEYRRLLSNIA